MTFRLRFVRVLPAALCVILAGCIIAPIPSPTRRVGTAGKLKELNLKSFAPGKTTRDEVTTQLREVDTGVKLPNGMWARWEKSKWTWVIAVGGMGGAAGGADRSWSAENLIAEFDDTGALKSWKIVRDTAVAGELSHFVTAGKRWDSDQPTEMYVVHRHWGIEPACTLTLQKDYLELVETGKGAKHSFKTSPAEIVAITTANLEHETSTVNVGLIRVVLRFRNATPAGDTLKVSVSPEHMVDILAYVRERAPQAVIK